MPPLFMFFFACSMGDGILLHFFSCSIPLPCRVVSSPGRLGFPLLLPLREQTACQDGWWVVPPWTPVVSGSWTPICALAGSGMDPIRIPPLSPSTIPCGGGENQETEERTFRTESMGWVDAVGGTWTHPAEECVPISRGFEGRSPSASSAGRGHLSRPFVSYPPHPRRGDA